MKKIADYITIVSFFIISFLFAAGTFMIGKKEQNKYDKENNIFKNAEIFVNESFPLKSNWKSLYSSMYTALGEDIFGKIYVSDKRYIKVMDKYNENNAAYSVNIVNAFASKLNKPVFMMIVPTAAGIYSDEIPAAYLKIDQNNTINDIYYIMDKKIQTIDCYYPLYSARKEYIYYRTEDCWTSFGAYYAYIDAIKSMGYDGLNLSNYDMEYANRSYYGNLYQQVYLKRISPDSINILKSKYKSSVERVELFDKNGSISSKSVFFSSALNTQNKTDVFLLGNNFEKAVIDTNVKNAPKLLVIKGKYANAFIPYLTAHYSNITVVDPVRLKDDKKNIYDTVDPGSFDQVLLLCGIDEFSSGIYDNLS